MRHGLILNKAPLRQDAQSANLPKIVACSNGIRVAVDCDMDFKGDRMPQCRPVNPHFTIDFHLRITYPQCARQRLATLAWDCVRRWLGEGRRTRLGLDLVGQHDNVADGQRLGFLPLSAFPSGCIAA
jgi:hypothetical protein